MRSYEWNHERKIYLYCITGGKKFYDKVYKENIFLIIYVLGAVEGVWGNLATNNYNDPWNKWFKKSTNQF